MLARRAFWVAGLGAIGICGCSHPKKAAARKVLTPEPVQVQYPNSIVFVPADLEVGKKYPLVVALSPSGDPATLLQQWMPLATEHHWLIMASRDHRNGIDIDPILAALVGDVQNAIAKLPVDPARIIATGVSGGGTGAHLLLYRYPDLFSAVIVNTGLIHPDYATRKDSYPTGKTAVFLASSTDPDYEGMKTDRELLNSLVWDTKWIEFAGGHTTAPQSAYELAASWLEEKYASGSRN